LQHVPEPCGQYRVPGQKEGSQQFRWGRGRTEGKCVETRDFFNSVDCGGKWNALSLPEGGDGRSTTSQENRWQSFIEGQTKNSEFVRQECGTAVLTGNETFGTRNASLNSGSAWSRGVCGEGGGAGEGQKRYIVLTRAANDESDNKTTREKEEGAGTPEGGKRQILLRKSSPIKSENQYSCSCLYDRGGKKDQLGRVASRVAVGDKQTRDSTKNYITQSERQRGGKAEKGDHQMFSWDWGRGMKTSSEREANYRAKRNGRRMGTLPPEGGETYTGGGLQPNPGVSTYNRS